MTRLFHDFLVRWVQQLLWPSSSLTDVKGTQAVLPKSFLFYLPLLKDWKISPTEGLSRSSSNPAYCWKNRHMPEFNVLPEHLWSNSDHFNRQYWRKGEPGRTTYLLTSVDPNNSFLPWALVSSEYSQSKSQCCSSRLPKCCPASIAEETKQSWCTGIEVLHFIHWSHCPWPLTRWTCP